MYPGYPAPNGYAPYGNTRPPGGGTAITAGILALLGCVVGIVGLISGVVAVVNFHDYNDVFNDSVYSGFEYETFLYARLACLVILAPLLGIGGVMLLMRRRTGRSMVIIGCLVAIVLSIGSLVTNGALLGSIGALDGRTAGVSLIGAAIGLIFPVTTLILAAVGATVRWIDARATTSAPAYGYPPNPYGQPNHYAQPNPYGQPQYPPY